MKRFIISILCVTVFSIGLGAIVETVGARFKSDEKALALIRQARLAIGGDQSIAGVRSMIIKGDTTISFKMGSEVRNEKGETEIAMQLPDKLSKMVKISDPEGAGAGGEHEIMIMRSGEGHGEGVGVGVGAGEGKVIMRKAGEGEAKIIDEKVIVKGENGEFTTSDGKKVIVRTEKGEGKTGEFTSKDGKTFTVRTADGPQIEKVVISDEGHRLKMAGRHGARQNELLKTTLSLLLTAPEGMDVTYTFVGEGDVDGASCNIVNASFGGSNIKLYLSKASSLPVMVSYMGHSMPKVMHFKTKAPEGAAVDKDVMFMHKVDAPELVEYNVRFSDYRGVNGVQLPYKWTTTVGGQPSEVFDVASYEINPANIAEKFQNQKTWVRTKKETN
jgi:hypothetical protein